MKSLILLSILFMIVFDLHLNAQSSESKKEEPKKESFSFGNISPVILAKDAKEFSLLSNLTSYWVTSKYGSSILDRYRISRSENIANLSYGFSNTQRWDLGVQIRYSRLRLDENARTSPFNVFKAEDATSQSFNSISTIGLRLRSQPIASIPELSLQASVNFPMARDQETRSYLGADRIQTDIVSTYYKSISDQWYLYLQGRYILQISNKDNSKNSHFPGMSIFMVSSLFDQKAFIFPGITYLGSFQQNYKGGRLRNQAQFILANVGLQIQLIPNLSLFINTQKPIYHKSSTSFYSDLVRNSYSDFSLGLRAVL